MDAYCEIILPRDMEKYGGYRIALWGRYFMDLVVDRRDGGAELLGGAHKLVLPINRKFGADNFGGDNYHVPISHGSVSASGISPPRRGPVAIINGDPNRNNVHAGNGHCIIGGYTGQEQNSGALSSSTDAAEYFKEQLSELYKRFGDQRGRQASMCIATMFPNFTWFGGSGNMVRSWHPRVPDKIEAWTYCIVDKNAPQAIKDSISLRLTLCFSPSGSFEQDDMDNFGQSTASAKYMIGKKYPVNVQMGLGHEKKHEAIPGVLSPNISEGNARAFYARWAEVMDAPSWSQISIAPRTVS